LLTLPHTVLSDVTASLVAAEDERKAWAETVEAAPQLEPDIADGEA